MSLITVEVVEHCCSMTSLQMGETMHNIAKDMDTYSYTLPLGKKKFLTISFIFLDSFTQAYTFLLLFLNIFQV